MSIPTRCPVCDAFYNLGEAQRGKRVLCRKCSNTFIVGEGATHSAVRKDALQTSPAPIPPPKSPPPIKPAAIRRDRDDEDERGGGRRDPRRKKAASPLPLILGIGGGLLLLLLLGIGVVMFIAYRMGYGFGSGVVNTTASASAAAGGLPWLGDPKDVDDALQKIRTAQTADQQNQAAGWLGKATVIPAKRAEAATVLETLAANANTHDAAVEALGQWAGPENIPTLLRAMDNDTLWSPGKAGGQAAAALIRLNADGAAEAFARRLKGWSAGDARRLLAALGRDKAETPVLKYLDVPDNDGRADARELLQLFGAKPELLLNQAIKDLRSKESGYSRWAGDFIGKQPVDPARQDEVARALETPLGDVDGDTRAAAATALASWATKENVPALIVEMDRKESSTFEPCVIALTRLADEKTAAAVAAHLPDGGDNRQIVAKALRAMGAVAQKAVAAYVNYPDADVRQKADILIKALNVGDDVLLDARLDDLTAKDSSQRKQACEYFADHALVPAKQKQVARALDKCVEDDKDAFFTGVPEAAAKALGVWGDKDSVPVLLNAMQKPNVGYWQACVDSLVKLKDERAVYPLLALVENNDFFHKNDAIKALNEMGPVVEIALDDALASPNATLQDKLAICKYLEVNVGTKASLPALQTATMDANAAVKNAALGAMNAIKRRNP